MYAQLLRSRLGPLAPFAPFVTRANQAQKCLSTAAIEKQATLAGPFTHLPGNGLSFLVESVTRGEAFDGYIETQVAPMLNKGDVAIIDNLNVDNGRRAAAVLAARGAWFLFLPTYLLDLNPMGMAFAKLKAHLHKDAARAIYAF